MSKVLVPIASGFEEIEAITIIDVLRRAKIEVVTAGLDKRSVLGVHGVEIKTDVHIDDVKSDDFDMIVLPGGMPGSSNLAENSSVLKLLGQMNESKKYIGAICAAPMALDRAGVLKNSFTCYPSFETNIKHTGYIGSEDVICDENIITSRGPGTAIKFSLMIVEKLCGKELSNSVKAQLLL
jgi:4-methyl-5(b-hydroxyethyl)-thiazole monophosphate biosynthesis